MNIKITKFIYYICIVVRVHTPSPNYLLHADYLSYSYHHGYDKCIERKRCLSLFRPRGGRRGQQGRVRRPWRDGERERGAGRGRLLDGAGDPLRGAGGGGGSEEGVQDQVSQRGVGGTHVHRRYITLLHLFCGYLTDTLTIHILVMVSIKSAKNAFSDNTLSLG